MHIAIFRLFTIYIDRPRIISSPMAQLPPRIPSSTVPMSTHWTGFARNHPSSSTTSCSSSSSSSMLPSGFLAGVGPQGSSQPSWIDEFLDFSASRRSHHRRSVSDSIAFFETPPLMDDDGAASANGEFDRLDYDQLMCMFPDDVTATAMMEAPPSSSAPAIPASASPSSSPSYYNIKNEETPATVACFNHMARTDELEEKQSACKMEMAAAQQLPAGSSETITDPKRVKRILANRQSAQRSRVRKLQYISELERTVTALQREVSALSPRVAFLEHQRTILTVGNSQLKQRIAALAQEKIFKDPHQEALRKEIGRLRQIYDQQNVKMMATPTSEPTTCIETELLC